MPRRVSRRHHLPAGGYREHRLAIWGVTGCVAVAAGVALTAGLAAASPQLGNIPGTSSHRPALAGLPTMHPSRTGSLPAAFGVRASAHPDSNPSQGRTPGQQQSPGASPHPSASTRPAQPSLSPTPHASPASSDEFSRSPARAWPRTSPPAHR